MILVLNSFEPQILFQEVPDHVSLGFTITGCQLRCKGCHSKDTWSELAGSPLSDDKFINHIKHYFGLISCVLFFGGEWQMNELQAKLLIARKYNLNTCLYTGLEEVPTSLKHLLTFLKTGPYIRELGGLNQPTTNQRFIELATGQVLNYKFQELQTHVAT